MEGRIKTSIIQQAVFILDFEQSNCMISQSLSVLLLRLLHGEGEICKTFSREGKKNRKPGMYWVGFCTSAEQNSSSIFFWQHKSLVWVRSTVREVWFFTDILWQVYSKQWQAFTCTQGYWEYFQSCKLPPLPRLIGGFPHKFFQLKYLFLTIFPNLCRFSTHTKIDRCVFTVFQQSSYGKKKS